MSRDRSLAVNRLFHADGDDSGAAVAMSIPRLRAADPSILVDAKGARE